MSPEAGSSRGRRIALRLATWNVNSVRLRLPLLARLADEAKPDVVCLQETKVPDGAFPRQAIAALGFAHMHFQGMKSYNGVAILSRQPFEETGVHRWCGRDDCRHIFVRLAGGLEIHNLYVPSGGDVPDAEVNDKFAHKLRFLDEQTRWWSARRDDAARPVLVGDLNVAPLETDVWSHKQLLRVVSHTPVEVAHLARLLDAHGWVDAVRRFVPPETRLYTWWSYRARDWAKSDRGRRLDHVWVSPALAPALGAARVLREARGWQTPSDHVPVIVDLEAAGGGPP